MCPCSDLSLQSHGQIKLGCRPHSPDGHIYLSCLCKNLSLMWSHWRVTMEPQYTMSMGHNSMPRCRETGQTIALTTTAWCRYWDSGAQNQAGIDMWPLRKCSLLGSCHMPTGPAHSALYCKSPESPRPSSRSKVALARLSSKFLTALVYVKTLGDACRDPQNDGRIKDHVCLALPPPSGNKIRSAKRLTLQIEMKTSESISSPNKRGELQLVKALPISSLEQARWMVDAGW